MSGGELVTSGAMMIQRPWFGPFGCHCATLEMSHSLLFASVLLLCLFFHSLHELVKHNENGLIFRDSKELAEQLKVKALSDFLPPEITPEVPLCEQPFQIWASPMCFTFSQGTAWPAEHCLPHFCLNVNLMLAKAFQILSLFFFRGARLQSCSCSWGLTLGKAGMSLKWNMTVIFLWFCFLNYRCFSWILLPQKGNFTSSERTCERPGSCAGTRAGTRLSFPCWGTRNDWGEGGSQTYSCSCRDLGNTE